jgi:hypothetical protein
LQGACCAKVVLLLLLLLQQEKDWSRATIDAAITRSTPLRYDVFTQPNQAACLSLQPLLTTCWCCITALQHLAVDPDLCKVHPQALICGVVCMVLALYGIECHAVPSHLRHLIIPALVLARLARTRHIPGTNRYARICRSWCNAGIDREDQEQQGACCLHYG